MFHDGRVIDLDDEKKVVDELERDGYYILRTRDIEDWQVERYVMNGAEILDSKKKWAGKFIPLIPQFGKITNVDGRQYVVISAGGGKSGRPAGGKLVAFALPK